MRNNEALIFYPGIDKGSNYYIHIYESVPDFTKRDFFEHKHSDFELSYVLSGEGVYRLGDEVCEISQGDLFVIGSNQVHCITQTSEENRLNMLAIRFEPRIIWSPDLNIMDGEYLDLFNGKCERLDGQKVHYSLIVDIMKKIGTEAVCKNIGYELMIKSYLCEIFALILRDYGGLHSERKTIDLDKLLCMDRAVTYINEHIGEHITLEEIARVSGFSRTYFSSVFTKLNGLKPWDYITIKRIEKSKKILAESDIPIIDVAAKCGYDNLSNYNRLFRRIVGMSPSEYRKVKSKVNSNK